MYTGPCHGDQAGPARIADRRSFTLVQLLATLVVAFVLLSVITPSLSAARSSTKTEVCLANLRAMGGTISVLAADHGGVLPGPLLPAISRHQTLEKLLSNGYSPGHAEYILARQLGPLLRDILGAAADRLTTCPELLGVVPDEHFEDFYEIGGRRVLPVHYTLHSVGDGGASNETLRGAVGGLRVTSPEYYFGLPAWGGSPSGMPYARPPKRLGEIGHASREWMIADAWYRSRSNPFLTELQQEGPYQWDWSGEALPNFAPHLRRKPRNYRFSSSNDRGQQSLHIRATKSDGLTNTVFFDGHAASVPSRTLSAMGFELLYGFPGTVNPRTPLPEIAVWR